MYGTKSHLQVSKKPTMNRLFLIIGPSGVGKSSAIDKVDSCDGLIKYTLDAVIKDYNEEPSISLYFGKIGNEIFFRKSIEAIERLKIENIDKTILIDVGAGSFDWEGCVNDFLKYQIISLIGEKEVIYSRVRNRPLEKRSLNEYVSSEFKEHKAFLYDKASFRIDTTHLNSAEVAKRITNIICKISN